MKLNLDIDHTISPGDYLRAGVCIFILVYMMFERDYARPIVGTGIVTIVLLTLLEGYGLWKQRT